MIDTVATRRMILNDREYQQGDTVRMPAQQFEDLEPTGIVTRAPAKKPPVRRAKAAKATVSKPAVQLAVAAQAAPDAETKSSAAVD